jgi:hypothetical protein
MEIGKLLLSVGLVYVLLFIAGMIISVASSGIQCQKTDMGQHAIQGAIWSAYPTGVYGLAVYFPVIRRFAVNTLKSVIGFSDETAEVVGVGYLMMLVSWVATVWNVHQTEKVVCNPDAREMTEFKQKLVAELKQKQETEEKDNEAAQNAKVKTA